jgi:opacity protein-like surface antigen
MFPKKSSLLHKESRMKQLTLILASLLIGTSFAWADEPAAPESTADETVLTDAAGEVEVETPAPTKKPRAKAKSKVDEEPDSAPAEEASQPVYIDKPAMPDRGIPVRDAAPVVATERPPLSRFSLGTYLSYWNAKDLDDFDISGFMGGGVVGQLQMMEQLALQFRLGGHAAGYSEDVFVEGAGWFENTLTLVAVPLEAGLVASLPMGEQFSLFAGGGAGFYLFDGEFTSEQGRWKQTYDMELDNEVGFFGLIGLRYQMARNAALYLEAKYTVVETSLKDDLPSVVLAERTGEFPVEKDIDLSGIAVQVGFLFTF